MLKSTTVAASLALALLAGCATHPPQELTLAANNPDCLKETGTHIRDADRQCVGLPGASYTQADIERTGQIDLGAALKQLDPRFR